MEPNRVEFQKQCIFQSFCKRVLHNEACNAHEEIRRRRAKEVSFSDLALHEERQLYTLDKYFQDEEAEPSYQQAGKKITRPKMSITDMASKARELKELKRMAEELEAESIKICLRMGRNNETGDSTSLFQYHKHSHDNELGLFLELSARHWYLLCCPKRHKHNLQLLYLRGQ